MPTFRARSTKLTAKQQRFVEEYFAELHATQAAIRAGYSPRTAAVIVSANLRKPEIRSAVQQAQLAQSERTVITAENVLRRYARIAFADISAAIQLHGESITVKALD